MPNGSIVEEVRNGSGAYVTGLNVELSTAPHPEWTIQTGGTFQRSVYRDSQVLFEPEGDNDSEDAVAVDEYTRTPNVYGYFTTSWMPQSNCSWTSQAPIQALW